MIEIPDFVTKIVSIVDAHNLPFLDAALKLCEDEKYDIDNIAKVIKTNPLLFSKIQEEAEDLHLIPKTARLKL